MYPEYQVKCQEDAYIVHVHESTYRSDWNLSLLQHGFRMRKFYNYIAITMIFNFMSQMNIQLH